MKRIFLGFFTLCVFLVLFACTKQSGCIDPNASNYDYDAKKDNGSCLFDLSFWTNSGTHLPLYIEVDGILKDSLYCYWSGKIPRCGVDTFVYDPNGRSYSCTANIPLVSGNHEVRIESIDGTIWENTYYLPENCLSILIEDAN